jgi:hypothetical protein
MSVLLIVGIVWLGCSLALLAGVALAVEIGIDSDDDTNEYAVDDLRELADLYESAADAAYETEVLRAAHELVQP